MFDWSRAELESRRQMRQIAAFLRRYVPGFEHSYVAQSGVHTGVRETRRIVGDYRLTAEDVLEARKFDDVIARGAYPVDIHNPKGSGTVLKRLPPGAAYDIPLRCLLPRGVDGVCGRRPLPFRQPRGAFVLSGDADRHGDRAGRRGMRRARREARPDAPRGAGGRHPGHADRPGRRPRPLKGIAPARSIRPTRAGTLPIGQRCLLQQRSRRSKVRRISDDRRKAEPDAMEARMARARATSNDERVAKEDLDALRSDLDALRKDLGTFVRR